MNDMLKLFAVGLGIVGIVVIAGVMLRDESSTGSRSSGDNALIEQWSKEVNQEYMALGKGTTLLVSPGSEGIWFSHLKGHCAEESWSAERCKTAIASYIALKDQEIRSQNQTEESQQLQKSEAETERLKKLGYDQ